MKYAVILPDGKFVAFLTLPGGTPPVTYTMDTSDSRDAHDFGSRDAAEKWIRDHRKGKLAELTDDGFWPFDE